MPENDPKAARITMAVKGCARCDQDHEKVEFNLLDRPIPDVNNDTIDYFGLCPTNGQPILLAMSEYPKYKSSQQAYDALKARFTYHKPVGDQVVRYEQIREHARQLALFFNGVCPDSRELSLALTNLEQAVMWANAAIARNEAEPPSLKTP